MSSASQRHVRSCSRGVLRRSRPSRDGLLAARTAAPRSTNRACPRQPDEVRGPVRRDLIKGCRSRLAGFEGDFAIECAAVLDSAERTLASRHALVHSLWPSPRLEEAYGWRPVRARADSSDLHASITVTVGDLKALVGVAVAIVGQLDQLCAAARSCSPTSADQGLPRASGGGGPGITP